MADGEFVGLRRGQQLRGALKGERNCRLLPLRFWRLGGSVLGDESAAYGKEGALLDNRARRIIGSETDSVGMLDVRAGRKQNLPMQEKVAGFIK